MEDIKINFDPESLNVPAYVAEPEDPYRLTEQSVNFLLTIAACDASPEVAHMLNAYTSKLVETQQKASTEDKISQVLARSDTI